MTKYFNKTGWVVNLLTLTLTFNAWAIPLKDRSWVYLNRTAWPSEKPDEYTDNYIDPKSVTRNHDGELVFWTKSKNSKPGTGFKGTYAQWKIVGREAFKLMKVVNFDTSGNTVSEDSYTDSAEYYDVHLGGDAGDWGAFTNWLKAAGHYKDSPRQTP